MVFESREEAGTLLADKLKKYGKNCVVLAIPRGGVVVGAQIAHALSCPLEVIITRKLSAPDNPELAIGATSSKGGLVLDQELIKRLKVTKGYIRSELSRQQKEARRREKVYLKGETIHITDKTVILVDDGIATGATVETAIQAVREKLPAKVVLAVPVAPPGTVERLRNDVDELVVLSTPEHFWAIGEFYSSFPQISDEEVVSILREESQRPQRD